MSDFWRCIKILFTYGDLTMNSNIYLTTPVFMFEIVYQLMVHSVDNVDLLATDKEAL